MTHKKMKNETATIEPAESYHMNGGDGIYSYAKNSSYQGESANTLQSVVDEEIAKSLDVEKLSSFSNTFCLADLGCSVGPNTFIHMQYLIDSIKRKYLSQGCTSDKLPEFQVFFSDHSSNDFNTLFTSLPHERPYFVAGVPGSFYTRLFPNSSLHLVNSSFALMWLSMAPPQCGNPNANAYNKGRLHYYGAPRAVVEAYAAQFANDMGAYLKARANEIMAGGMMVTIFLGSEKDVPHPYVGFARYVGVVESILLDMVKMGKIDESKLDSFNIPIHLACPEEMIKAVNENGDFSIEKMQLTYPTNASKIDSEARIMLMRAVFEPLFSNHFGSEISDDLFDQINIIGKKDICKFESSHPEKCLLLVVLKRK